MEYQRWLSETIRQSAAILTMSFAAVVVVVATLHHWLPANALYLFLWDLAHQILFYIGGFLALVEWIMVKYLNTPLEKRVFTGLVLVLLFVASFQAWVDEHHNAEQLTKEKANIAGEREFWKGQSYAKDQSLRDRDEMIGRNVEALSETQLAFARLSDKVLDVTHPEPLRIEVKLNELSSLSWPNERKLWIITLVSNKPLSPVRGTISCTHPFMAIGTPVIVGESATMVTDAGVLNDHEVRLGIVSPALNPDTPVMMPVSAPDNPGLGKCTFKRD